MDRKTANLTVLLVLSNLLAITSVATPSWVKNSFDGTTRIGLTKICIRFEGQDAEKEVCEPLKMSSYWAVSLVFMVIGICLISLKILLLLSSIWLSLRISEKLARIIEFLAMLFFCIACIIFPFGFHIEEIGGQAYKLPEHTQVGISYYTFCGSVGLLTAAVVLSNSDVIRENLQHRLRGR